MIWEAEPVGRYYPDADGATSGWTWGARQDTFACPLANGASPERKAVIEALEALGFGEGALLPTRSHWVHENGKECRCGRKLRPRGWAAWHFHARLRDREPESVKWFDTRAEAKTHARSESGST